MGVAIDRSIVGGGASQNVGPVAVRIEPGKPALRCTQRCRRSPCNPESEKDVTVAIGGNRSVDKDAGIVGGSVSEIISQGSIEHLMNRSPVAHRVRVIYIINGTAAPGIVE